MFARLRTCMGHACGFESFFLFLPLSLSLLSFLFTDTNKQTNKHIHTHTHTHTLLELLMCCSHYRFSCSAVRQRFMISSGLIQSPSLPSLLFCSFPLLLLGLTDVVMYESWHNWRRRQFNMQSARNLWANTSPAFQLFFPLSCRLLFFFSFHQIWALLFLTTTTLLYFPAFPSFSTHA